MVDIKDLTINYPKSFKMKTRNLGELEFANPTMKHIDFMRSFAMSKKSPKTAFIEFLSSLLMNPKQFDLSKLSDIQLKKIGLIILKTQGLHGKYDRIKKKRRRGNFYEKNKSIYKDYVRSFSPISLEEKLSSLTIAQGLNVRNMLNQYHIANRMQEIARGQEITRINEAQRIFRESLSASQSTLEMLQQDEIKRNLKFVESNSFHEFEKISAQYLLRQQEHVEFLENLVNAYAPYNNTEAFLRDLNTSYKSFERELRSQTFILPPSIISETFDFIQDFINAGIFTDEQAKKDVSEIQQVINELRTQSFELNDLDMTESQAQKFFIDCVFIITGLLPHLVLVMDPSSGIPYEYLLDTIIVMLHQIKDRFTSIKKES